MTSFDTLRCPNSFFSWDNVPRSARLFADKSLSKVSYRDSVFLTYHRQTIARCVKYSKLSKKSTNNETIIEKKIQNGNWFFLNEAKLLVKNLYFAADKHFYPTQNTRQLCWCVHRMWNQMLTCRHCARYTWIMTPRWWNSCGTGSSPWSRANDVKSAALARCASTLRSSTTQA